MGSWEGWLTATLIEQQVSQWAIDAVHFINAFLVGFNSIMIGWLVHRRRRADKRRTTHWGQSGLCSKCALEVANEQRRTRGEQ